MENIKNVPVDIFEAKQCKGADLYLLDVESTWKSEQLLSGHCSIIENYIQSTPVKDMVVKVERCRMVGIRTIKSFNTVDSVEKSSTIVPASDCDVVYSLSCESTWESEIMSSHSAFKIKIPIPKEHAEMQFVSMENSIDRKANIFCSKLSDLLNDESVTQVTYSECGSKLNKKNHLEINMTTHSDIKGFKCDQCGKTYYHSSSLRSHMTTHSGSKKYECDQCDKKFNHKGNLKVHMTTHTGIKGFKCDQCGKKYYHSSSLRCHVATHTQA